MDYRRHIRLVTVSAFITGIYYLRTILLLPILARCLGVAMFGTWGKIHALVNLLAPVAGLGALEAINRLLPAAPGNERPALFRSARKTLCVGSFILLAAACIPGVGPAIGIGGWLPVAALLAVESCMLLLLWNTLRALRLATAHAWVTAVHGGLILLLALVGWHLLGKSLLVPVLAFAIAPVPIFAYFAFRPICSPNAGEEIPAQGKALQMIRYGMPLLTVSSLVWCAHCADRYMLSLLRPNDLGDAGVGRYVAAYAMASLVAVAHAPFWMFYEPQVTELMEKGEIEHASHLTKQTVKYALIPIGALFALSPFLCETLLPFVAGSDFTIPITTMLLIMAGFVFFAFSQEAEIPLRMKLRSSRILLHALIAALLNITLNLYLIPRPDAWGGLTGAALATTAAFGSYFLLNLTAAGIGWLGSGIFLQSILAAGIAALAGRRIEILLAVNPIAAAAISLILYTILLFSLGIVSKREIKAALAALSQK